MKNSKLVRILSTFTGKEFSEFEKVVVSPYFNKGRNYLPFLNQLKKFAPEYDSEKLTYEYIFSRLYPGKKFNKQFIWNMNSALFNMAEEYLVQISLHENRFRRKSLIAEQFHHRKLPDFYDRELNQMEKLLEGHGIGEDYFLHKISLSIGRAAYYFLEDKQSLLSGHISEKGDYAIMYFLNKLSSVIADMNANSLMFNARFEPNIPKEFLDNFRIEKVLEYAKVKKFRYAWVMEMYYCLIMINLDLGNTGHFFRLKELFEENYDKFTEEEKISWIVSLTNFCSQNTTGGVEFKKTLFEINKFQLREGIGISKRKMPKILFIQILRNALAIDETEWVKNYIEEYVPKLRHSYQGSMHAFGMAYLNLKLKNFDLVIKNLVNVRFIDDRDKLLSKSLYVRAYYELNETDVLLSQIDSALHFVNNTPTIRKSTSDSYRKSLNILKRLVTVRDNGDSSAVSAIRRYVDENEDLLFRGWFIEKIEEIKKGAK
ncbi:MAG: hypothetical protein ACHQIH_03500 [Ignavibacteria bacterium]